MNRIWMLMIATVALSGVLASTALAQGRSRHDHKHHQRVDRGGQLIVLDRDGIVDRRRSKDRRRISYRDRRGKGPAFCRSGAGHPVHGRAWCVRKGFGLGDRRNPIFRQRRRADNPRVIVYRDGSIVIRR